MQMWNTRNTVIFLDYSTSTSFHEMFVHVTLEIRQQFHLFLKLWWIRVASEISFFSFFVNEMNVAGEEKKPLIFLFSY
jgi:hypothetical protein